MRESTRALAARPFVLLRERFRRESDRADGSRLHVLRARVARSVGRMAVSPRHVQAVLRGEDLVLDARSIDESWDSESRGGFDEVGAVVDVEAIGGGHGRARLQAGCEEALAAELGELTRGLAVIEERDDVAKVEDEA